MSEGRGDVGGTGRRAGALLAVLALGLLGCQARTDGVVKIGVVAPFSGYPGDLAYAVHTAVRLAVAEVNRAGGVNGRPVLWVSLDDANDPAEAAARARELAADPAVVGVVGHLSERAVAGAAPVYARERLVLATPAILSPATVQAGAGYVVSLGPAPAAVTQGVQRLAAAHPGPLLVLTTDAGLAQAAAAGLAAAGRRVRQAQPAAWPGTATSWEADAIVLDGDLADLLAVASAVRQRWPGWSVVFLPPCAGAPLGQSAPGLTEAFCLDAVATDEAAFRQAFQDRLGRPPDPPAVLAYRGARWLLAAVAAAPASDRARLVERLTVPARPAVALYRRQRPPAIVSGL